MIHTYNGYYPVVYSKTQYKDAPYTFTYDTIKKGGRVVLENPKNCLQISGEIARRINALLFVGENVNRFSKSHDIKVGSNCHITSSYIAGLDNEMGNIFQGGITDRHLFYDESGKVNFDIPRYENLEEAVKNTPFPFLLRIKGGGWGDGLHSIIVLGISEGEGRIIGFEQAGIKEYWKFIDVQEVIDLEKAYVRYQGISESRVEIFCKSLDEILPSKK